ncbi:MAG: hypothetical protein JO322_12940 [Candidatus Eremiobacteraeota bacterium]|nr:hypothetical protein [Candidatus Eremiobacteraeota bacterium]
MSKRILAFAFAAAAMALAACNNGNVNNLYGSATATPVPTSTSSPSPNPTASTAVVSVYYAGSPLPNQPVTLSTSVNQSVGTPILTQNTDSTGKTTFSNLTPATWYCFSSTYQPPWSSPPPTPLPQYQPQCSLYWGTVGVTIDFNP